MHEGEKHRTEECDDDAQVVAGVPVKEMKRSQTHLSPAHLIANIEPPHRVSEIMNRRRRST